MLKKEQIEHINIVNWFKHKYPELEEDFHHFANERKCTPMQGQILKRMGVKKGVSDFFLAIPTREHAGLWIELKVDKGKLSSEQIEFINRKNQRGYCAMAVWGKEAAKEMILNYLKDYHTYSEQNIPKTLYNNNPIC
jgi:hypothetical protein